MRSTQTIAKELRYLRARTSTAKRLLISDSRVEFAQMLGVEPDPWQADFLSSEAPRILMNCSRQSGKSTMSAIRALHEALMKPGALVLILAPAERQAQELFGKVTTFYRHLGQAPTPDSDRKSGMQLANGSRIEALPGSSDRTIRGYSGVDLLILDEASRVIDELYFAIRPMLAVSGGSLLMLSSPAGKRGIFYEAWVGDGPWERYEITAYDCPRITDEFLEEERRSLPARIFRQEYLCSFEEAEGQVFSEKAIQESITEEVAPMHFDFEAAMAEPRLAS